MKNSRAFFPGILPTSLYKPHIVSGFSLGALRLRVLQRASQQHNDDALALILAPPPLVQPLQPPADRAAVEQGVLLHRARVAVASMRWGSGPLARDETLLWNWLGQLRFWAAWRAW